MLIVYDDEINLAEKKDKVFNCFKGYKNNLTSHNTNYRKLRKWINKHSYKLFIMNIYFNLNYTES